ncbi:MAG: carbohydrate ABC transporter permease [Anaerolineales bacterium]|uniref:carbohydrate ABC transporter permease n=1 Tax=Candidatus Villigracilis affinis TaxID=3140682 RepID=UPI002A1D3131|nr:carbohydrate ABC transporter permease [Anaerolineales bacterium]MBL0345567.1 carbohydrate ABC transporter permease [Anaerolineales bacterium]
MQVNSKRRIFHAIAFHAVSILISALFILPLVWMASASLRQPGLPPPRTMEWWPEPLAWSNYNRIFEMLPLGRYIFNSLLVAGIAVPITLVTASLAGFAMTQLNRRGRESLLGLSVVLLVVPTVAVWVARFILFRTLGLFNSYAALLAPALMGSSPLFVLLFFWSFRRIPRELYDAARMDGAGPLEIWWRVALPLSGATVIVVGILTFLLYWGDFTTPLFYLKSQTLYTLPVGLRQLQELDRTNWPLLLAGAMVMTLPSVLLFGIVQRFFLPENRLAGIYGQ